MSKSAALDYAKLGIRINVLAPGITLSPMLLSALARLPDGMKQAMIDVTPLGRLAEPVEIARVAIWMLSSDPSFMTGGVVSVDGGYTAQ